MSERINKLAAQVYDQDIVPPLTPVEYDPLDLALPEAIRNGKRIAEFIRAQTVYLTDSNRFTGMMRFGGAGVPGDVFTRSGHTRFDEAKKHFYAWVSDPDKLQHYCENLVTFEWQHSAPDYRTILEKGLEDVFTRIAFYREKYRYDKEKAEFLEALELACKGVAAWAVKCAEVHEKAAESCADPVRKVELAALAAACRKVPMKPAESFYEGLHCILFCFYFLPDSIGTIDRYLIDLYKQDLAKGILTRDEAKELLQEFFIHISAFTPYSSSNGDRSAECHFAIGGYNEYHEDGFNELSRLIVEALMEIDTRRPSISLRWTAKTSFETLKFMMDCERNDKNKRIAFCSDEPRLKSLMENCGLPYGEAIRYTMVGCNEPAFPGMLWMGGCTSNIVRSLTNTLYNRTEEVCACETFEDFFAIYCEELKKDIDQIIRYINLFNDMRAQDNSILSCFMLEGCIESGTSATRGGCKNKVGGTNIMGQTCVIDSLSIIKQFVYDEKCTDMAHLIEVMRNNWENDEDLHNAILKDGRFFGNSDPLSDEMARRFTTELHRNLKGRRLKNGAHILIGSLTGYNPHYACYGAMTEATPDGRYRGEPYMVGTGQASGKDRKGIPALLKSVAQMDPTAICTGPVVVNLLLDEVLIRNDEYFDKVCRMIETYFKLGGIHVQLNYVSKEELLAARKAPEQYRSLKVRVSGFSASFVGLADELQDEILNRTAQKG
ncbi:MAG: hypothetical protein IJD13_02950 [Oscillospiraceae bacterium]|nr:hypothetical protein [Oscillospiraceae bacterium]